MTDLYRALPPEGVKIVLVLFLAFLLGLEREEHKATAAEYAFGGVRTFPLIGLIGYATALLSDVHEVSVAHGRDPPGPAGPAVRRHSDQPVQDVARSRRRERGVLWQLRHSAHDERRRRRRPRGRARRCLLINRDDPGAGQAGR